MKCFATIVFFLSIKSVAAQLPLETAFSFETGNLNEWSLKRLPGRDDARVVSTNARHGGFAAEIGLAPGVRYKDGWKNELSDPLLAPFHQELWYRISHYIPNSFTPLAGNACMLAQWHNTAELGLSPLLSHIYQNGTLQIWLAYATVDVPVDYEFVIDKLFWEIKIEKEKWHDFVYRVIWPHGGEGLIEAWHNGKHIGTYRGLLGYRSDVAGPYFKTGVYCTQTPEKTISVYVDEYRRGRTKESVLLPGESLEQPPTGN